MSLNLQVLQSDENILKIDHAKDDIRKVLEMAGLSVMLV